MILMLFKKMRKLANELYSKGSDRRMFDVEEIYNKLTQMKNKLEELGESL